MKRAFLALCLVATAPLVSAPAAHAAPPPAVPILAAVCDGFLYPDTTAIAQGVNGRVHGFANYRHSTDCDKKIFYFEGAGSSWRSGATGLVGTVVDVAQDNTGSYLLYLAQSGAGRTQLVFVKRATDGTFGQRQILADVVGDSGHNKASIVARGGRWLAVWTQPGTSAGDFDLYQYGTMYPATAQRRAVPIGSGNDTAPALTFAPDGTVVLAFKRGAVSATKVVRVARTTNGSTYSWQTAASGVSISNDFPDLDVAATSAGTFVAWTGIIDGIPQIVVADNLTGRWRTQTDLPAFLDAASWDASIVATGARAMAGYASGDEYPTDANSFAKRTSAAGAWTEVTTGGGVPGSIDSKGVAGLSLFNGSVTAVVFSGDTLYALTGLVL